jgi:hypothetical protein
MNFIMTSNDIKLGLFPEKQPYSNTSVAFVYINALEEMVTIQNGQRLNTAELRAGKFNKMFRIDITPKALDYNNEFSSMESVETFYIKVSITVQVSDPLLIMRNRNLNYTDLIHKQLFFAISDIAKKHSLQQFDRVTFEVEGLRTDTRFIQKLEQIGLRLLDVSANVDLSEKSKKHLERLNNLEKDAQYQKTKADIDHSLKTTGVKLQNNERMVVMDGLAQLTEMYGLDGTRIALATSDAERAQIISEIQEKQQKKQQEQDNKIKTWLKEGYSAQEVETMLKIGRESSHHTFNPTIATAQSMNHNIEEPKAQTEDPLLSGLSEIIDSLDKEKGE